MYVEANWIDRSSVQKKKNRWLLVVVVALVVVCYSHVVGHERSLIGSYLFGEFFTYGKFQLETDVLY